jgi:hypothetical protein
MSVEFKIIGFTDSVNDCDCCGRSELKGTYCVSIDGNEFYYGVTCASKHTGLNDKEIKSEVKKINNIKGFDLLMAESKNEYTKLKVLDQAIKKGYSKDEFFLKHGALDNDFSSQWQNVYVLGSRTHSICK